MSNKFNWELKDKVQKHCKENDLTLSQLTKKLLKNEERVLSKILLFIRNNIEFIFL